jgi:ABC-type transport system involved in multi-copper enzyme maturation permease subunit
MFLLPVAAREVREASRQSRTYAWRWITAGVALVVMAFIGWVSRYSPSQGHDLFMAISTIAFIYCLLAGAIRTADTIAEEKRENTLGLLFLTDLKGWDIILGKLLSSSVNCLFGLLALIPMLAIPMLMGGVQWMEFIRVNLALLVTLFLSISWGFLVSSLFRMSVVTISASLGIMIFLAGGVPLLALVLDEEFHLKFAAAGVFVFSPTHCHVFAFDSPAPAYIKHYWTALAINFAIALFNLRLAIFFLPRFWQDVPKNKKTERWRNKVRALRFGKSTAKARLRTRLLNQNPFYWLANREQVSSAGLMAIAVFILFTALAIGIVTTRSWSGVEEIMISWMIGLALVHLIIAFRMAMSASFRLAEDRRSGALELLLATEVSIREILRGYWMALGRQFFGPIMIVVFSGAFATAMVLILFSDHIGNMHAGRLVSTAIEIVRRVFTHGADKEAGLAFFVVISIQLMLALNWIALIWLGMWLGLRERRPGFATWVTLSTVFVPPWVVLIAGIVTVVQSGMLRGIQPDEGIATVLTAGWILGLSHVIFLSWWGRRSLLNGFREAAADRYMGPRPIAWPRVRKVLIRFAAAGACALALLYAVRLVIDRSGDKAWAQALAAHPEFKTPRIRQTNTIADDDNLARAPLMMALLRSSGSRKTITWNLMTPTPGRFNAEAPHWAWTVHGRTHFAGIEENYIDRKLIKERRNTPAETVLAGLSKYDEDLHELREQAKGRPLLRYDAWAPPQPAPFASPPFYMRYNPALADARRAIRHLIDTLALRTSARIDTGSADTEELFLALRFAAGIKDVPQSLLQYHEAMLDCVQTVYDGLTLRAWNSDELKKIQDYFARLELWRDFDDFREDYTRQVIEESEQIIAGRRGQGPTRENWVVRQAPTGLRRKWQAQTLEWTSAMLPKIVDVKARRIDAAAFREIARTRPAPPHPARNPDQVEAAIRSIAFVQTAADQIVVACALERFRKDHGNLPGTPDALQKLVPKYLSRIPQDVFTGEPLRFKLSDDGQHYTIYSVGPDGTDDSATAAGVSGSWQLWRDDPGKDWVWNSNGTDAARPTPRKK